jgi:ribosomal protein S18 acetylase RimI-like enzyme
MELRLLTEADAAAYRALRLRALREDPVAYITTHAEEAARPLEATIERLRAGAASGESLTLGAFDTPDGTLIGAADDPGGTLAGAVDTPDGALVGNVTLVRSPREKLRHKGTIVAMYVAPEVRRRGVGRALLLGIIARARQIALLEQLHLGVVSGNLAARALYRSVGFVVYGVEPAAIKHAGEAHDEDLMVLLLGRGGVASNSGGEHGPP